MHRSIFISNLTQRRKPDLFEHFKDEQTVTFYYKTDPADELSTAEIINRFTIRETQNNKS